MRNFSLDASIIQGSFCALLPHVWLFRLHLHLVRMNRSPEENEDGFPVGDPVQLLVVVEVRLYAVNQAGMHLVHLVEDEHGVCAAGDVAPDPLLELRLRTSGFDVNKTRRGKHKKNDKFQLKKVKISTHHTL